MKECSKCGITKPDEDYYVYTRAKKDGTKNRNAVCCVCQNASAREWAVKNREKRYERHRRWYAKNHAKRRIQQALASTRLSAKRRGGSPCITDVGTIRSASTAACHICGEPDMHVGKHLCLDHNHVTGKFRGWLCTRCNRAIGLLGDSSDTLRKAAAYLDDNN